jgi:hypothetical protein
MADASPDIVVVGVTVGVRVAVAVLLIDTEAEDVAVNVGVTVVDTEGERVMGGVRVRVIEADPVTVEDREREGVCDGVVGGVAVPVIVCVTEPVAV